MTHRFRMAAGLLAALMLFLTTVSAADPFWYLDETLLAQQGVPASVRDFYGWALALDGDTLAVGAPYDDGAAFEAGAVEIWKRVGSEWVFSQKLTAPDAEAEDELGTAVALDGNILLASAVYRDDGAEQNAGAVYVFTRATLNDPFAYDRTITAPDGAAGDQFGISIVLEGEVAVIGAPYADVNNADDGKAYLYSTNTWSLSQTFDSTTKNPTVGNGLFGISLHLSDTQLFVGAVAEISSGINASGAVHVYDRAPVNWSFEQRLTDTGGAFKDLFGASIQTEGDDLFIGAPFDDDNSVTDSGAVYRYSLDQDDAWQFNEKLYAGDPTGLGGFGAAMTHFGSQLLIGAPSNDDSYTGTLPGAAYLFELSGSVWSQAQRIDAGTQEADAFGLAVAFDGVTPIIGAPLADEDAGAAYSFSQSDNAAPVLAEISAQTVTLGETVNFTAAATEEDTGDTLSFSLTDAPAGASINQDTGAFTWTPDAAGVFSFDVVVSDDGVPPLTDSQTVSVTVNEAPISGPFTLLSPADDTIFRRSEDLSTLSWTAAADALSYRVTAAQISGNVRVGPVITETVDAATCTDGLCSLEISPALSESGLYAWTVTDNNAQEALNGAFFFTLDLNADRDLLNNGGFEIDADADKQPDAWTVKNRSGDKLKCNKTDRGEGKEDKIFARSGECAFMFVGKTGERARLQQNADFSGLTLAVGDTLALSLWSDVNREGVSGRLKLVLKYSDDTPNEKQTFDLGESTDYTETSTSFTLASTAIKQFKVQVKFNQSSGKLYVDDVRLTHSVGAGSMPIPLPEAPENFRR